MASTNRIMELASIISRNTAAVNDYFEANSLPTPSFNVHAPAKLPIPETALEVEQARQAVIEASKELRELMMGPAELVFPPWTDNVGLQAIARFDIARKFPVGEETTFEALASSTGLSVRNVRRLMRQAMTNRIFCEPRKGVVAHTALSRLLAEEQLVRDGVASKLDEYWAPSTKTVDALEKWPNSEEPNETGFSLANNTDKSMWEFYAENPKRSEKFAKGMGSTERMKGYEPEHIVNGFPWNEFDGCTVVDVGGSHGSVMINLAREFPKLNFVIQDLPGVVKEGEIRCPPELKSRIRFMAHNFFEEQIVSAHVYYLRSILHNWSDKYSLKILRNLVPALKPGSRVLIHEIVLPEPNTAPPPLERRMRDMDIAMLQLLNSHQRDADEWQELFAQADARFHYLGHSKPKGSSQSFIVAEWKP